MKGNILQLSHGIKNIYQSNSYQEHTHWTEGFPQLLLLKVCGAFLFRQSKKTCGLLWSVWAFFKTTKQILLVRGKFIFLYLNIWFDMKGVFLLWKITV